MSTVGGELAIDALDVGSGGAGGDDQFLRDFRDGQVGDQEPQHLEFALAERLNQGGRWTRALRCRGNRLHPR